MALQDLDQTTIVPAAGAELGRFQVHSRAPLIAGSQAQVELIYKVGERGLAKG